MEVGLRVETSDDHRRFDREITSRHSHTARAGAHHRNQAVHHIVAKAELSWQNGEAAPAEVARVR
jgi:hypothetical protein